MKNKWISVDKSGMMKKVVDSIVDTDKEMLMKVQAGETLDKKITDGLKKRKTILLEVNKYFWVEKGSAF
jgi:hypothetical protein